MYMDMNCHLLVFNQMSEGFDVDLEAKSMLQSRLELQVPLNLKFLN